MTTVGTPARPLCAADVMSVSPDENIYAAWALMTRTGLRHLVVAEGERCVGVIDDRAVFAEWPMGPLALKRHCVRELMHSRTACVFPDSDLQTAAAVMTRECVDAVPVVAQDASLVGIVTASDIIAALAAAQGAKLDRAWISHPAGVRTST